MAVGRRAAASLARCRASRPKRGSPRTARPSSAARVDGALLVARASLHGQTGVLRKTRVGLRSLAHGEHASTRVADDLLMPAAVAEPRVHAGKGPTFASKGLGGESRSECPM